MIAYALDKLFQWIGRQDQQGPDAYLHGAKDLADIERRMRNIERDT